MSHLRKLLEPISIGMLALHNRITMPAITSHYDFEDSRRWEDFYAERARGGARLLIIGAL